MEAGAGMKAAVVALSIIGIGTCGLTVIGSLLARVITRVAGDRSSLKKNLPPGASAAATSVELTLKRSPR
jgi:hypothetical protein